MWRSCVAIIVLSVVLLTSYCGGQKPSSNPLVPSNLHTGLTESIGNFSVELLYLTSKAQPPNENLVMSPFTIWTVLAVLAEGAADETLIQILQAARIGKRDATRAGFNEILRWLQVNTSTVQLAKVNTLFIDKNASLERDFQTDAQNFYKTRVVELNFLEKERTAFAVNEAVCRATRGRITKMVDPSYFENAKLLLTSALYFKGQWTAPFAVNATEKAPFYDANGRVIGEVNMMYRRYNFGFANVRKLEARIVELPYGVENRLSMLIMLPNPNVTIDQMFSNFYNVTLDSVFKELKESQEMFSDDEVDCFIPRFKIESNIEMNSALKYMKIVDMFDKSRAKFHNLARTPLYVSKVVHKAEIEVTEEGTTASAVTSVEFANRISVIRFDANRPFAYMIIEKVTNSIVFGGLYQQPSLY